MKKRTFDKEYKISDFIVIDSGKSVSCLLKSSNRTNKQKIFDRFLTPPTLNKIVVLNNHFHCQFSSEFF
jgi:hypothetical protein